MAGDIADVYLKFEGFAGECRDEQHPGDEGWITIKSFNFGFGFEGKDGTPERSTASPGAGNGAAGRVTTAGAPAGNTPKTAPRATMKSGPMSFDRITFSKSSDVMSYSLMEACHNGVEIPKVELEACRYGGAGGDEKLPFLHLTFERVHLKSCKLNLAVEGLPTEDVEFEYEKVEMKCLWTDNATGNRLTSQPIAIGWDLQSQETIDEASDDDGGPV
jgi:type VI protein secretion system component Hcp